LSFSSDAVEVTASELRIEMLFPADQESDAYFREAAAKGGKVVRE
jgi:hypothetical protein